MTGMNRRSLIALGLALPWPVRAQSDATAVPALQRRALRFPRDHGSHNDARTEWWYLTGHVQDGDGRAFGFQLTFFRNRVDAARELPGRLAARQLLMVHAAITDVRAGRLQHEQGIARWNGQSPAGQSAPPAWASSDDLRVSMRNALLQRLSSGDYQAQFDSEALGLELRVRPQQAILLQGEAGWSRKGPAPDNASFYVSHPQLAVQGRLRLQGTSHDVQGTAWLDHEWSESILHPEAVGWDWVGMNLDSGDSLTAFRLRRADGSALWAGGSWRPAGNAQQASGARHFGPDDVQWTPLRHWSSPRTGARYPVQWQLHTPAGNFSVEAAIDPQEVDGRQSTGTVYWEGLAGLMDAAGRRVGRGYLEMTGYEKKLTF